MPNRVDPRPAQQWRRLLLSAVGIGLPWLALATIGLSFCTASGSTSASCSRRSSASARRSSTRRAACRWSALTVASFSRTALCALLGYPREELIEKSLRFTCNYVGAVYKGP